MPHIHTKTGEHDHTASAFLLRLDSDEPKILMHRHRKLGVYMQFGGHIETTETPWQAITHELKEESGYDISQIKVLQPVQRLGNATGAKLHPVPIYHKTHSFTPTHYHTDVAYAFVTKEAAKYKLAGSESDDLILITREELINLDDSETIPSVREAALFVFDVCLKEWEEVSPSEFD